MRLIILLTLLISCLFTKAQFCGISNQVTYVYDQSDLNVISGCINFLGDLFIDPDLDASVLDLAPLSSLESIEGSFIIDLDDNYATSPIIDLIIQLLIVQVCCQPIHSILILLLLK